MIEKLKNLNGKAWLGIVIAALLGALGYANEAGITSAHLPEWVWPVLVALGITVQPYKK